MDEQQEYIKLDFSIKSPQERSILVQQIIDSINPEKLTPKYLDILANYIIFAMTKEERKEKKILTDNRMVTVNKRETSFEGLVEKLENGEDGIYNMMSTLGKNAQLTHKDSITKEDLENIKELRPLKAAIEAVEQSYKKATGKKKFLLKKQLIEMRQEQYIIKNAYKRASSKCGNAIRSIARLKFDDNIYYDKDGNVVNDGVISFFNPTHIEALLCNYGGLKTACYGQFEYDLWYLMQDLDELIDSTLSKDYPLYYDILNFKINGYSNLEIQNLLIKKYGIRHTIEYISSLWRNKIPKLLAESAQNKYILWDYRAHRPNEWKTCSRCGETKPAHNRFFSKNSSSKDGFYSLCKCCRNKKSVERR